MSNPFKDELESACYSETGMTLNELLSVIGEFEKLRKLFDSDALYTQRAIGLARGTSKENPIDCPFVMKALREMFTNDKQALKGALNQVRETAQTIEGLIGKL